MSRINYKSDFKIVESSVQYDDKTPFRYQYYVNPGSVILEVSFDGQVYKNCSRLSEGSIMIPFNNNLSGLPIGSLQVDREYYLTDNDYRDSICNLRSTEYTGIELVRGKTDTSDVNLNIPPNYQKGDPGEPMSWDKMTSDQKNAFKQEVILAIQADMVTSEFISDSSYEL